MHRRRFRIHWAWVPAGIFVLVTGGLRYGWLVTVLVVIAGVAVGASAELRASRRARRAADR